MAWSRYGPSLVALMGIPLAAIVTRRRDTLLAPTTFQTGKAMRSSNDSATELEYLGEWWLPDRPDHRVVGTLQFSRQAGPVLQLLGDLSPHAVNLGTEQHPAILGDAIDVGKVTLRGCWQKSQRGSRKRGSRSQRLTTYKAQWLLVGQHFPAVAPPVFKSISVTITHLKEWVERSGIEYTTTTDDQGSPINVAYSEPASITAQIRENRITIMPQLPVTPGEFDIILSQEFILRIDSDQAKTLRQWLDSTVYRIVDFFTLATGSPNRVEAMYASIEAAPGKSHMHALPVEVLFMPRHRHLSGDPLDASSMVFSYERVANTFDHVVNAWNDAYSEMTGVIRLYLSALYNRDRFPFRDAEFLSAVQAVESFHRRNRHGLVLDRDEHEALRERILTAVEEADRPWLEEKLRFSNEKPLAQRIRELIEETSGLFDAPMNNNVEEFIKKVKNTRNYLTHYDSEIERKKMSEFDTIISTEVLLLILQLLILRRLGFSDEESSNIIRGSKRYSMLQGWDILNTE